MMTAKRPSERAADALRVREMARIVVGGGPWHAQRGRHFSEAEPVQERGDVDDPFRQKLGLFLLAWALSVALWKFGRIEQRGSAPGEAGTGAGMHRHFHSHPSGVEHSHKHLH